MLNRITRLSVCFLAIMCLLCARTRSGSACEECTQRVATYESEYKYTVSIAEEPGAVRLRMNRVTDQGATFTLSMPNDYRLIDHYANQREEYILLLGELQGARKKTYQFTVVDVAGEICFEVVTAYADELVYHSNVRLSSASLVDGQLLILFSYNDQESAARDRNNYALSYWRMFIIDDSATIVADQRFGGYAADTYADYLGKKDGFFYIALEENGLSYLLKLRDDMEYLETIPCFDADGQYIIEDMLCLEDGVCFSVTYRKTWERGHKWCEEYIPYEQSALFIHYRRAGRTLWTREISTTYGSIALDLKMTEKGIIQRVAQIDLSIIGAFLMVDGHQMDIRQYEAPVSEP